MPDLQVCAPMDGVIVSLSHVPDPAFAKGILGDGLALDSSQGLISAPFDGTITSFNKSLHAFVLKHQTIELLVHIGLETVALNGEGFVPQAQAGEPVLKGQPILRFDPQLVTQKAACPYTLLVITSPVSAQLSARTAGIVHTGDPLFTVTVPESKSVLYPLNVYIPSDPITIKSPYGLHARPAGAFAAQAALFEYPIQLVKNGQTANAKSVLEILKLAVKSGDRVSLRVFAPEEAAHSILKILTPLLKNPL